MVITTAYYACSISACIKIVLSMWKDTKTSEDDLYVWKEIQSRFMLNLNCQKIQAALHFVILINFKVYKSLGCNIFY